MQFSFGEQQLEFRSQLRAFAEKECGSSQVRLAWSSPLGWSPERWGSLADMGVVGMTVPERHGGLGLGLVDLILLLEEAGRACMPEPLIETVALAVPLLVDAEREAQREVESAQAKVPLRESSNPYPRWLEQVAEGGAVMTVGVAPHARVVAAEGADLVLLEHRPHDEHRTDQAGRTQLHAVRADQLKTTQRPSLDGSRRVSTVEWSPSPETLLVSGPIAERLISRTKDRAATATAGVLLGLADRMISMASRYALERKQFGKQIGSFQAVKHHLANALIRLEFARPVVYRAAWSIDTDDAESTIHASMAKAHASEAAQVSARVALQVHGAIGYTWEHDLHMWMKRAWALASSWGDASFHRALVVQALVSGLPAIGGVADEREGAEELN
jgi:alkylation response protein AidB-like acyl-CoA dehydrogenase